jgi:hypothetical protein
MTGGAGASVSDDLHAKDVTYKNRLRLKILIRMVAILVPKNKEIHSQSPHVLRFN